MASRRSRRARDPREQRRNGDLVDNREPEIKGTSKRKSGGSMEGSPPVRKRQRVRQFMQAVSKAGKIICPEIR